MNFSTSNSGNNKKAVIFRCVIAIFCRCMKQKQNYLSGFFFAYSLLQCLYWFGPLWCTLVLKPKSQKQFHSSSVSFGEKTFYFVLERSTGEKRLFLKVFIVFIKASLDSFLSKDFIWSWKWTLGGKNKYSTKIRFKLTLHYSSAGRTIWLAVCSETNSCIPFDWHVQRPRKARDYSEAANE